MFRKFMTYLLIGTYIAMQTMVMEHCHAALNGKTQHKLGVTHVHLNWDSTKHHHHHADQSHAAHGHHSRHRSHQVPPSSPLPSHDTDAIYVGDAFIASGLRIAEIDAQDGEPAVALLSSFAPVESGAQFSPQESADDFFAGANLYLILRALRI